MSNEIEDPEFDELPDLDADTVIPSVHGRSFTPAQIAKLAVGLTKQQIAESLGMSYKTLRRREQEYPGLEKFLFQGKAQGVATVVNALYQNALKGNLGAQIFFLKNQAGWKDKNDLEVDNSHTYLVEGVAESKDEDTWQKQYAPTLPAPQTKQ